MVKLIFDLFGFRLAYLVDIFAKRMTQTAISLDMG